jgi:DNA-binding IclR family transcriptional regulator
MAPEPEAPEGAHGLPGDVARFLTSHIDSLEQLEILLFLHERPGEAWTVEAVAHALYANPESVGRRLAKLQGGGLLLRTAEGAYGCCPNEPELAEALARLAHTYRERRVAVITHIASRPLENMRAFADAFRLGRRKD